MFHFSPLMIALAWMVALFPARSRARAAGYIEIAQAIVDACDAEVECMAELVAIAKFEGDFTRGARGLRGEIGTWQIMPDHLPRGEKTTVREQAAIARDLVARSKRLCKGNLPEHRLALYASGDCRYGKRESEHRLALARRLAGEEKFDHEKR